MEQIKDDERMTIYIEYPYLVPCNDYSKWEGVIYSKGKRHHLVIKTPYYPSIKDYTIFCSGKIESDRLSSGNRLDTSEDNLLSLLRHVVSHIVTDIPTDNHAQLDLDRLKSLKQIVDDIEISIGRENVDSIDPQTSWIKLKYTDSVDFNSFITIGFEKLYPEANLKIIDADLPYDVISQFPLTRRLGDLYSTFRDSVESLMCFWKMTNELGAEAWIIEPLEPTRKDVHRRIFLSDNLSAEVTFNPLNLESMPDIKFLGSLGAVSQARDTYQRNLQNGGWWSDTNVVSNICRLLGIDSLPKKADTESQTVRQGGNEEESNDCAICYEISVEGETLPAKWCSNKHCSGRFHHSCLMEWLNSVATSKTSFDHISGPCPHCDEKIFCPVKLK